MSRHAAQGSCGRDRSSSHVTTTSHEAVRFRKLLFGPVQQSDQTMDRTAIVAAEWLRDASIEFAIGYPYRMRLGETTSMIRVD